jgi:tRNA(Ser,Leu) C12 N-acetylase TAN1
MNHWNVIVTSLPGREHQRPLLHELNRRGTFHRCSFKDICLGYVANVTEFLDEVLRARQASERWVADLGRIVPVEHAFPFTRDNLVDQLKPRVASMLERMNAGTFYVRCERRGHAGEVMSREVERAVADHVLALAQDQHKSLRVSFEDPDYIVCVETVGDDCGVALLSRALLQRYPFIHVK